MSLLDRRRRKVSDDRACIGLIVGLAFIAATIEISSTLPYLAALGIIATNGVALPTALALLAGYNAVMIAPVVSWVVRIVAVLRFLDGVSRLFSR